MTDKLIEQIIADREAGTPGNFSLYEKGRLLRVEATTKGPVCVAGIHRLGKNGGKGEGDPLANGRRFARVPDMEARILSDAEALKAADELAEKLSFARHVDWTAKSDKEVAEAYMNAYIALAAYRKAREGKA